MHRCKCFFMEGGGGAMGGGGVKEEKGLFLPSMPPQLQKTKSTAIIIGYLLRKQQFSADLELKTFKSALFSESSTEYFLVLVSFILNHI